MVNFFNQFFIKRIYKGPSTHFVKPKALNIRYKGNLMPNYIYLNLEDIFTATPELIKKDDGTFNLQLNIIKNDNTKSEIQLGVFKSEKFAKEAYVKTINAFFSPSISIIKTFLTLTIIVVGLQASSNFLTGVTTYITKRNAEILRNAELETERKARAEMFKMQEMLKNKNPNIPGQIKGMPSIPEQIAPSQAISPNTNTNTNIKPQDVSTEAKKSYSKVHEDLDEEINRIRQGKKDGNIESAADILLKELKGN